MCNCAWTTQQKESGHTPTALPRKTQMLAQKPSRKEEAHQPNGKGDAHVAPCRFEPENVGEYGNESEKPQRGGRNSLIFIGSRSEDPTLPAIPCP
ncbi:hypothetical protein StoSoilB5_38420 [Arthrobacter sp. StoSoilB5]|nr:hypothetical protein StoSoilB5_38420 [Arthrobacter sp. StoSoilB5]